MNTLWKQKLVFYEGYEHKAYPDPLTHAAPWTIGIGHTGPEVHEGLVWNDDQIDFAYQLDEEVAMQGCFDHFEPWFGLLVEPRQFVLFSMCFQMGIGRLLGFTHAIAAVRDQHFALAAAEMSDSDWARQTPTRARRLAYQMETGEWQ